ncbi:hypothetical protein ACWEOA_32540, partial [Streptomyces sp. NPDC004457]
MPVMSVVGNFILEPADGPAPLCATGDRDMKVRSTVVTAVVSAAAAVAATGITYASAASASVPQEAPAPPVRRVRFMREPSSMRRIEEFRPAVNEPRVD